ncbi:PEP/pyruvate-binding domain-containing protein [Natranaerobius thermophilus]|uniref:Pyruvate phosphate dikinase PEP/pyruvate-binding n=1 Tax=Natranaerobius thermophilus (strain ATCC BAA-1301 / DSM 18059 / JW/NM-WN-LF) TaxID=457570 RepID=B2A7N9_NATTJ|nr:PEP/pyruvate-binding domain-containing protein [Natranaerobius thermophilus]ACB84341.1 pyruvate phosphate dikinase PEP/pyruvate-binding [Natranaerobius thermophilus JW/NM-WN-LF]
MNNYKFIKLLENITKDDQSLVGGKGANLGEMINAGLPVPGGFVLLTTAYKRFVQTNGLQEKIDTLIKGIETRDDNLAELTQISEEIQNLFEQGDIPEDILEEIESSYQQIGEPEVAVRSSATSEDLPGTSFAGQYETYLNVLGKEELCKYIKKCWASLWNLRALSYRIKQKTNITDLAHGVVVQKLIYADKSGILFTANPVNGRRDQMLLNSSWGLGEAIVGGEVTPDQWILDKNNNEIVTEQIAKKEIMTIRQNQGIDHVKVPDEQQTQVTLDNEEVLQLLQLGSQVENYYGFPQDIEWAYSDDKFYLVQTRPITSLFPMPEPLDEGDDLRIYLNMSLYSQALHEPFTPMGEAFFTGMFKSFAKRINRDYQKKPVKWCKTAGGRLFIDLTELLRYERVREKFKNNPADKDPITTEALLQVVERNKDELIKNKKSPISVAFKMISKMNPWVIKFLLTSIHKVMYGVVSPDKAVTKAFEYGQSQIANIEQSRNQLTEIEDKLRYIEEVATRDIFVGLFEVVFYVSASTNYIKKAKAILKKYNEDTSQLDKVEQSVPNNVTTEMGMELLNIAKELGENGEQPDADHPQIREFLNKYGHRSSNEVDIGIPRWYEKPQYVVDLVQAYMDNKSYDDGISKFYQGMEEAQQVIGNITNRLREQGGHKDAKKVKKLLENYRKMFGVRELPKFYLTKAFSILREMLKDIGTELQQQGKLDDKLDIFFVNFHDLKSMENLKEIVTENKEKYFREMQRPSVPRIMTNTGESIYSAAVDNESEGVYSGVPVSPGVIEGVVRVINHPEEGSKLKKGEILVTKGTNPAWTPLFLKISGLIMETGGPISHGSVVAREYGLPAVAGVSAATDRLVDGQKVRLNGETGNVEILEDPESHASDK